MAKRISDNDIQRRIKNINKSLDIIDGKMSDVFQSTYSTRDDNKRVMSKITDDIYSTINSIVAGDEHIQNIPNITRLYNRIDQKSSIGSQSDDERMSSIIEILSDKALTSAITTTPEVNRYIKSLDVQYDMICKYMPKLEEALALKKDNVLSADNFNKDFINFVSTKINIEDKKTFDERNQTAMRKYKFDELCDKMYDDASHYGEYFLWCVPYKTAFEKILQYKGTSSIDAVRYESCAIMENGSILADYVDKELGNALSSYKKQNSIGDVNITFDKSFALTEAVKEYKKLGNIMHSLNERGSLTEAFNESVVSISEDGKSNNKNKNLIFDPSVDYGKEFDNVANDGLILNKKKDKNGVAIDNIPGCICKKLKHENVCPIYIENICIGYYYFEFDNIDNDMGVNNIISSSAYPTKNSSLTGSEPAENPLLKELARKISDQVDAQFINANQDLKDEIYIMLKYNEQFNINSGINNIRVTFLPAEDVFHFYFELDENTHHGISDLSKSLTPAMFWVLLDLSTTLGIVTRSQDKRIFYVKQNVDTNVARSLMNVVNQVKKGNFGVRQMESMNNILNIIGRYNDLVIPQGPNGDSPIQFEVLQGQDIKTPEELLNRWEEMAINPIVPLEVVNSSMQMDYAIKYSMANSKFLRTVYKRQFICMKRYSEIYTRIYNYEYGENESLIEIRLPAPAFLSMTNSTQLLQNTTDFISMIAQNEYTDDQQEEKAEFTKAMLRHYLPTHINVPLIDRMKETVAVAIASKKEAKKDDDGNL